MQSDIVECVGLGGGFWRANSSFAPTFCFFTFVCFAILYWETYAFLCISEKAIKDRDIIATILKILFIKDKNIQDSSASME